MFRTIHFALLGLLVSTALGITGPQPADARGFGNGQAGERRQGGHAPAVMNLPVEALSQGEQQGLLLMREEEKLARDVYLALFEQWQHPAFANIARSEQQHMDAMLALLDKYGLADPVAGLEQGTFFTPEMQELHDTLAAQGSNSLVDALLVGATIEDLDIRDLYELQSQTDNQDIAAVYANLAKGSRNHLRAFTSQLARSGISYEARYLSQEQVDEILNSAMERGPASNRSIPRSGPGQRRQGT